MRMLNFTFKNEARWIMIFHLILILLGMLGLLVVRIVRDIS